MKIFEEWWEKRASAITKTLQNNHGYLKPFFKEVYLLGKSSANKCIECGGTNNKHLFGCKMTKLD